MKKRVYRERYKSIPIPKQDEINKKEDLIKDAAILAKKIKPLVETVVEARKYATPKIAKELKKKSDK